MPVPTARQNQPDALPLLSILKMLWNRKRLVICCWLVATAAAAEIVRLLPTVYMAEAIVLVDSQKIPEDFVASTVTGDVADRLALISQSIMTSARLLDLMHHFGLYKNERGRLTQEELLLQMRHDISLKVEKSWTGGRMQAFRLGYQGSDPKIVAEVTNQLARLYVTENLQTRQSQAASTVDFLHQQLHDAKASLDGQEDQLARFKLEHNGALPEQENALLGNLTSLRLQFQGVQESISQGQQTLEGLKATLSAAELSEQSLESSLGHGSPGINGAVASSGDAPSRLQQLQEQLRILRLRYTTEHPEVQTILGEIEEAKQEAAAEDPGASHKSPGSSADQNQGVVTSGTQGSNVRPEILGAKERIAGLHLQIASSTRRLESLQREREDLQAKMLDCQQRIEKLPLVEQQMTSLKRNYDESANHYNSLLQKELSASMATQMERSHDSEQFTVVDPARVPQKPVKPKRLLLTIAGSFAGLAIGVLLGFALEFSKQNFLGEWEIPKDIPILGRIPLISTLQIIELPAKTGRLP